MIGLALVATSIFAAWRIVSLAMADYYSETDPAQALAWRADHPEALLRLAERELAENRYEHAEQLAKRAVAADPLDGRPYRVLAAVARLQGDPKRQAGLVELAVRHSPRDVVARAEAAHEALKRGDVATAIHHYDRLLRVAPQAGPVVYPALTGLASAAGTRDGVVATLTERPPWRSNWLRQFAATAPSADALRPVFDGLRVHGGLSAEENAALIGRYVKDQRWEDAFLVWVNGLGPEKRASLSAPMNPGFEDTAPPTSVFDWNFGRVAGVDVGIRPLPDDAGHALRIEFQGQRSVFRDARQLLLLPPATGYRLKWRSWLDGLHAARGLRWTLTCAGAAGARILATEPQSGSSAWRVDEARFDVPANCPAQWLELELEARVAGETEALGVAWFDDVTIEPPGEVAMTTPAPGP